MGAVYTTNQTAGQPSGPQLQTQGRALYLHRSHPGAAGPALPPLPLLASLAVREQPAWRYGVDCQINGPTTCC